jgi:signal transduction histidine kinase/CheY-like chemotaxis protein
MQDVMEIVPEIIPADAYAIWRYDARLDRWSIVASAGLSSAYVSHSIDEKSNTDVLQHGPFFVENVFAWPLVEPRRRFYEDESIRSLFVLPLHIRGEAAGTLACYFRTPREITAEEHELGRVLGEIVSAAISARKFDRFAEAARVVAGELDLQRVVQAVTDAATDLTNAQFGAFFYNVVDQNGESYMLYTISGVPREAFSQFPMPRNTKVFEPTFSGSGIVRSADIRKDPRYGRNAPYHGMPPGHLPVVSYLAVPVTSRAGQVLGGLFFGHGDEGVFTENEELIAEALAAQASIAIDNARLYDSLRTERERLARIVEEQRVSQEQLRFLAEASDLLSSSLDFETTLKTLANLAVPKIADWCAIDIAGEDGAVHRRLAVAHTNPEKVQLAKELRERFPPNPEIDTVSRVIRTGQSEWLADIPPELILNAPVPEDYRRVLLSLNMRSFIVAPLKARDRVFGAVTFVFSDSDRHFSESDVAFAEELARRAAVSIENARLYTAAQAANRAKDEFLATLSHELRTPMTAVLGWARMMKMGLEQDEVRQAVDAIERSATVQMDLIEDILDMSRIMAGKMRIDSAPVDLRGVAEAAIDAVRPAAAAKNIEILTSFAPDAAPVLGDAARLQQVVWNLLTNAVKFNARGGSVVVRLAGSDSDSTVSLMVRDTGAGIARSFLPYVFEPFRQEDSSSTRAHGGIGLGLAIVRSLVELHGGRITADSDGEGRGATFTVELPALQTERRIGPVPAQADDELPSLEGVAVLVIDDQMATRDVVAAILHRSGATVACVDSAGDAFRAMNERRPDVIVCDIAMPGEDGYDFVRRLRDAGERVPVIALTAFGRPEDREKALASGFDAFLKKPVDPVRLATTVLGVRRP